MKKYFLGLFLALTTGLSFAQGSYLEFKLTGINSGITGTMKMYAQDGNSRTEMHMDVPRMPGGAIDMTTLFLKNQSDKMFMVDDKTKTYNEVPINASSGKSGSGDYEVTVLGKETVNGYKTTHVKVKAKGATTEIEMWTSTDISNYDQFKKVQSKYTSDALFKALAAKGAEGFPVRIKAAEHGQDMQMDLVKAEMKSNPYSYFSLDGYTKSTGNTATPNSQEMMQKIQNMTPAERDAYIQQLKQQYGGGAPH